VVLVDVKPGQSVESFARGDYDAIVIWQPYSYRIQKLLSDKVITWSAQNDQLMYWNLLATDAWLGGHSDAAKKLLRALAQAEQYLMLHPREAKEIVQKRLRYDDETMTAIWPDTQFVMSLDQSLLVAMEDEARWMISNRRSESTSIPDFFNHIYLEGLSSVRPEVVTIIR
jgi:ABC-type nitrate/sulfonate/bicarbonate transport system substrate-binding protein